MNPIPGARGRRGWLSLAAGLTAGLPLAARAQAPGRSPVPVPPAESALPTTIADRPVVVAGAAQDLEGAVFDRDGALFFSDVQGGRVLRLEEGGRIAEAVKLDGLMPGGLAFGRDGRLFVAASNGRGGGAVLAMRPDGTGLRTILPEATGLFPNDLVFDASGGFYVTDCRGTVGDPAGGVWYVSPDGAAPVPVVRNLAVANRVALSPDGRRLWVGEFALGRLYRLDLAGKTGLAPFGAVTAYHFNGPAPDSMRVDAEGRVYVALYGQGRVLIISREGLPVGQILLPGRDAGRNLSLTSLAIRPGRREMAIVTSDGMPGGRATIFRAVAPGDGLPLPSP